jgi:hypothetical protein
MAINLDFSTPGIITRTLKKENYGNQPVTL